MEQRGINPTAVLLLAAAAAYLFATPGVIQGAVDYYILAPLQRLSQRVYTKVSAAGVVCVSVCWGGGEGSGVL